MTCPENWNIFSTFQHSNSTVSVHGFYFSNLITFLIALFSSAPSRQMSDTIFYLLIPSEGKHSFTQAIYSNTVKGYMK